MIVVSWNCRGLGTPYKANTARDILTKEVPNIFMIQETKTNSQETRKMIQKLKNYEGIVLKATGASERICTLWEKRKWEMISQKIGKY